MQNKPLTKDVMLDTMDQAAIEELFKEGMAQMINAAGAIVQINEGEPKIFSVIGFISANLPEAVKSCYEPKKQ